MGAEGDGNTDCLIIEVLRQYSNKHMSAKAIRRTIERELGVRLTVQAVVVHLRNISVDVTDTSVRRYRLKE